MWYCKVEFVSGKEKKIVFQNEDKANDFYNTILNNSKKKHKVDFINNNYDELLINLRNIEVISKPIKFKEKD